MLEYVSLLVIVLAIGIVIGWAIERGLVKRRRQAWRVKNRLASSP